MGRIVVGVDGSEGSVEALRWALEEARLRGDDVRAVHAWTYPIVAGPMGAIIPPMARDDVERTAEEALEESIAELSDTELQAQVERVVVEGSPSAVLVEESEGADLLVIGSRGHGDFAGLLLGSVSHQCAHRSWCPVVIIPSRRTREQSKEE